MDKGTDQHFSAYMMGSAAALEDSKEQIKQMDLWRSGEGNKPIGNVLYAYYRELAKIPVWLEEDFKEGYQEKWGREIELFGNRLFD